MVKTKDLSKVISVDALKKIKQFYDVGGKVLATNLLPSVSTKKGQDSLVKMVIGELFGTDAATEPKMQTNQNGGMALFMPKPDVALLSEYIDKMVPYANVIFSGQPKLGVNWK